MRQTIAVYRAERRAVPRAREPRAVFRWNRRHEPSEDDTAAIAALQD